MSIGEQTVDDLVSLVGRELDGRYTLVQFIDRGGFGAVYRGIDKKFNLPVAVKVGLSYREFMKEAKLAAEVRHDHIVQVSDYGNDHGLAYLVMEFLQGDNLEKLFRAQGNRLSTDLLRKFVREVGDALTHAHAEHLIHRDLKPRNIILKEHTSRSGTTSTIRKFVLLDFGIAAKLDAEGTQRNRTHDGAGTVEYMAPELLKYKPAATPMADIYAFGVILFELLTGRVPFQQKDGSHLAWANCLHAISNTPPPRLAQVARDREYPPGLENLVLQCLEKEPEKRPQTIEEVRDRCLALLEPPPRRDDRVDAPAGRRWMIAVLLTVIGATVGGLSLWARRSEPYPRDAPIARLSVDRQGQFADAADQTIPVMAGTVVSLAFAVDNLPGQVAPTIEVLNLPHSIQCRRLESPTAAVANFELTISDLNEPASQVPVTFRGTLDGWSTPLEKTCTLDIVRPVPWLPGDVSEFVVPVDARLVRLGQRVYASVLERRSPGGSTVRFRLIPSDINRDRFIDEDRRPPKTFYLMETLVTHGLFHQFAKANPAFEWLPRGTSERPWERSELADYPVTGVLVMEAQQFARWLAGRHGSLPTSMEWDVASGYYDLLQTLGGPAAQVSRDKLRNHVRTASKILGQEAWIGLGPSACEFGSKRECSPYGIEFPRLGPTVSSASSRPRATEMTATLVGGDAERDTDLRRLFPPAAPIVRDDRLTLYQAVLRGCGTPDPRHEFQWVEALPEGPRLRTVQDFHERCGTLVLLPEPDLGVAHDSYIGFRVALLPELASQ